MAGARVVDVRAARSAPAPQTASSSLLEARVTGVGSAETAPAATTERELITRAPVSHSAPAQAALPPAGPPSATVPALVLSDGSVIRATGLGFIGRAPRAPESIAEAILVRVPDGARSLSRTHASFGVEDGQLWVQDLGSANGASVRRPDGAVTQLEPHSPCFLEHGDVLVLGGDAELAIRRVRGRSDAVRSEPPAGSDAAPVREAGRAAARAAVDPAPPSAVDGPPSPGLIALQFEDGTAVPIHGSGYIGRAPSVPDGEPGDAALITVPDGDRSVSRTHGRFGIIGTQTWFEDLGSGNGSSLRTGDGRQGPMTPNQRFTLVPGMVIQLGDCVIRVVAG
jgi:pSer/pThr/pTyr-binding forkhead associated (FHA) protein